METYCAGKGQNGVTSPYQAILDLLDKEKKKHSIFQNDPPLPFAITRENPKYPSRRTFKAQGRLPETEAEVRALAGRLNFEPPASMIMTLPPTDSLRDDDATSSLFQADP